MKSKSVITRHSFIGDQKIHREYYLPNSPTNLSNIPEYFFNGLQIKSEEWYLNVNGKFHRTDGPAYSFWKKNGELECEEWWLDGNRHRTDGPAYRTWYENGELECEEWFLNGNRHRTDGPAYQRWYENGELECEEWWLDGNRHRTDGPAYRPWYENGQPRSEGWYLDGKEYTKENYWKKMFEMVKQGEIKKTVDMEVNGLSALI